MCTHISKHLLVWFLFTENQDFIDWRGQFQMIAYAKCKNPWNWEEYYKGNCRHGLGTLFLNTENPPILFLWYCVFRHAYYAKRKQIYFPANRFTFLTIWLLIWCTSLTHHFKMQMYFFVRVLEQFLLVWDFTFAGSGRCEWQESIAKRAKTALCFSASFDIFTFCLVFSFSTFLTFFQECPTRRAKLACCFVNVSICQIFSLYRAFSKAVFVSDWLHSCIFYILDCNCLQKCQLE